MTKQKSAKSTEETTNKNTENSGFRICMAIVFKMQMDAKKKKKELSACHNQGHNQNEQEEY